MSKTTSAYQDLLATKKINAKDLSDSTQKLIEKYKSLKDGDEKEELDSKIYDAIESHSEKKPKSTGVDVSKASTATGKENADDKGTGKEKKITPEKTETKRNPVFKTMFGN